MANPIRYRGIRVIIWILSGYAIYTRSTPFNSAATVITNLVCSTELAIGHIGTLALPYPSIFAGNNARDSIWSGIQSNIMSRNKIAISSTTAVMVVLPAIAGRPPEIPPNMIDHFVLLLSSIV